MSVLPKELKQKLLEAAKPDPYESWVLPSNSPIRTRLEDIELALYYMYNYPPRIAQMLWCPEPCEATMAPELGGDG